jgi:hypothetical protein
MNRYLLTLFILLGLIISCDKEDQVITLTDETFTGTFQRDPVWSDGPISNVSISFTSDKWTGQSDSEKYPALCHGSYVIDGSKITFVNDCVWTAEFDWSLILSGEYSISFENGTLEISRDYSNATTDAYKDIYILEKGK